jgi:hypothetical protein
MDVSDIPIPFWVALFGLVAAPVAAWSIRTVGQASRVVSLDGKRLDTIAAQAEYIAALEQKCKALQTTIEARDVTIKARDHEYGEALRTANTRILRLEAALGTLEVWSEAKEKRAGRQEAREIRDEARDDATIRRQHDRADRAEVREIARDEAVK